MIVFLEGYVYETFVLVKWGFKYTIISTHLHNGHPHTVSVIQY